VAANPRHRERHDGDGRRTGRAVRRASVVRRSPGDGPSSHRPDIVGLITDGSPRQTLDRVADRRSFDPPMPPPSSPRRRTTVVAPDPYASGCPEWSFAAAGIAGCEDRRALRGRHHAGAACEPISMTARWELMRTCREGFPAVIGVRKWQFDHFEVCTTTVARRTGRDPRRDETGEGRGGSLTPRPSPESSKRVGIEKNRM
jgi:hypothetical protein